MAWRFLGRDRPVLSRFREKGSDSASCTRDSSIPVRCRVASRRTVGSKRAPRVRFHRGLSRERPRSSGLSGSSTSDGSVKERCGDRASGSDPTRASTRRQFRRSIARQPGGIRGYLPWTANYRRRRMAERHQLPRDCRSGRRNCCNPCLLFRRRPAICASQHPSSGLQRPEGCLPRKRELRPRRASGDAPPDCALHRGIEGRQSPGGPFAAPRRAAEVARKCRLSEAPLSRAEGLERV